jgi:predicted nucleic acid-binding protein
MNVVDSSAWIEYFTGSPNAKFFEPPILNRAELVVPTMVLLEVYKHIRRHQGRDEALKAVAGMKQGEVQDLDERLAWQTA